MLLSTQAHDRLGRVLRGSGKRNTLGSTPSSAQSHGQRAWVHPNFQTGRSAAAQDASSRQPPLLPVSHGSMHGPKNQGSGAVCPPGHNIPRLPNSRAGVLMIQSALSKGTGRAGAAFREGFFGNAFFSSRKYFEGNSLVFSIPLKGSTITPL